MWAAYKGRTMVVQELLDRGANPNVKAEVSMSFTMYFQLFHLYSLQQIMHYSFLLELPIMMDDILELLKKL